jgi:hypothetical protein
MRFSAHRSVVCLIFLQKLSLRGFFTLHFPFIFSVWRPSHLQVLSNWSRVSLRLLNSSLMHSAFDQTSSEIFQEFYWNLGNAAVWLGLWSCLPLYWGCLRVKSADEDVWTDEMLFMNERTIDCWILHKEELLIIVFFSLSLHQEGCSGWRKFMSKNMKRKYHLACLGIDGGWYYNERQ